VGMTGGKAERIPCFEGVPLISHHQGEVSFQDVAELLPVIGDQGMPIPRWKLVDEDLRVRSGKVPERDA